jgi:hypothetical protein
MAKKKASIREFGIRVFFTDALWKEMDKWHQEHFPDKTCDEMTRTSYGLAMFSALFHGIDREMLGEVGKAAAAGAYQHPGSVPAVLIQGDTPFGEMSLNMLPTMNAVIISPSSESNGSVQEAISSVNEIVKSGKTPTSYTVSSSEKIAPSAVSEAAYKAKSQMSKDALNSLLSMMGGKPAEKKPEEEKKSRFDPFGFNKN